MKMSKQKHTPSEMNFKELLLSLQAKDKSKNIKIDINDLKPLSANNMSFVFKSNKPIDPKIFNFRK